MQIKEITGGYVTIELEVSTCLTIASACKIAADAASDDEYVIHAGCFTALRAAFQAFALVGVAPCGMDKKTQDAYTPATVAQEWGSLPLICNHKEVTR